MSSYSWIKWMPVTFVLLSKTSKSHAFDPFTAMASKEAVSSIIGGADEIQSGFDTFTDLAEALGTTAEDLEEAKKVSSKFEDLYQQARKSQYASQELRSALKFDWTRSKSFLSQVRGLSRSIGQTKKLVGLLNGKTQTGGSQGRESTLLSARIAQELRSIRLTEINRYQSEVSQDLAFQLALEKVLEEERQRSRSLTRTP